MPPTSSPVPSLSSVLSAVLTVHTIASGSPLRHHRTINQQPATTGKRLGLSVILPASSSSPSSSILQVVRYGKAKEQTEQEEREPGRRMPPPSSPVPLFCLMPPPSTPSPAAHHFARFCQRSGRGTGGYLVRFWAMSSTPPRHHLTTDRPAASDHRAAPRRSAIMPASSTSSSLIQVLMVGQRASQGGRFPPAHPVDPLHPAGVHRHICGRLRKHSGGRPAIAGRRGSFVRFKVSGIFARLYCSKYQLFIFSARICRATPVHRGYSNCT